MVEVGGLSSPIVKTFSSITGLRHNRHAAENPFPIAFLYTMNRTLHWSHNGTSSSFYSKERKKNLSNEMF